MNTTCKRLLVPGAFASLAAMALISAGQDGNGGNNIPGLAGQPTQSSVSGTIAGGASHVLVTMSRVSDSVRDVHRVTVPAFSSILFGTFSLNGSGMDRQPGTRNYFASGGMTDGGNLYIDGVLIGATGWSSVPGLAFTPDGALWGSAAVTVIGDGLISIDPTTGAGTLVGTGFGGPGGIDAIAWNPGDSTMYANTGFFYDGLPGDVITIDVTTGIATDTGIDTNPIPPTVVAGLTFAADGQGYMSIGAGSGEIWAYDTTGPHTISFLGDVGGSGNDLAVAR